MFNNIDDLQAIAHNYLQQRREEIARCETIIREKSRALLDAQSPSGLSSIPSPAFGSERTSGPVHP